MAGSVLYVYAIGEEIDASLVEGEQAVDGGEHFATASADGLSAVYSEVDAATFSQEEIDRHNGDLQWLGSIGYRHEAVVARLSAAAAIIPLRAFTLFSSRESLEKFLSAEADGIRERLSKIGQRDEWTLRLEFVPEQWAEAIVRRVDSLRALSEEMQRASEGRSFLLKKKFDEQRKNAARDAETRLLQEVEETVRVQLPGTPVLTETRQQKNGSFPQLNLLIGESDLPRLRSLQVVLEERYEEDGVRFALTGPWPPYSFAAGEF
jgi:hypothetical protein